MMDTVLLKDPDIPLLGIYSSAFLPHGERKIVERLRETPRGGMAERYHVERNPIGEISGGPTWRERGQRDRTWETARERSPRQ